MRFFSRYIANIALRYSGSAKRLIAANIKAKYTSSWQILAVPVAFVPMYCLVLLSLETESEKDQMDMMYEQLLSQLRERLKENQIEIDLEECKSRAKPWSSYHRLNTYPRAIVYPESTEDVSFIIKTCSSYGIPIIPFGGGTSIEGQTLTPYSGISLDFANMKNIIEFNEQDLDITVQAGLGYIELNEQLKRLCTRKQLWFPLDPGPGASIGGMCACRCSGSTAVRYGSMRENVLSLTAVLPDGTIIKTGSRARKSSAGYDITRLLIGSIV